MLMTWEKYRLLTTTNISQLLTAARDVWSWNGVKILEFFFWGFYIYSSCIWGSQENETSVLRIARIVMSPITGKQKGLVFISLSKEVLLGPAEKKICSSVIQEISLSVDDRCHNDLQTTATSRNTTFQKGGQRMNGWDTWIWENFGRCSI